MKALYIEKFFKKISPFSNVIEKLLALKPKYKDEGNEIMQFLIKLLMNALYGLQIRKYINES